MSDREIYEFDGEDVEVAWDGRLCIHVGECTRAKRELFVSGRKPWGQPDNAPADTVAEVVERCPTGALFYTRKDGGKTEAPAVQNTIIVSNNGPLYAQGDLAVDGAANDMPGVRYRAALCRCGASKQKPFCDNSHETSGFVDRGPVGDGGPGIEATGGTLEIQRAKNGPLIVSGNLTILASSGRPAWRGTKAALCRCGASTQKPFCDGAHVAAGFEAD